MKYLLIMNSPRDGYTQYMSWPKKILEANMALIDNPLVALNHAIATAMVDGPNAGLALLAPLEGDERLRGNHRLAAVRAHLLERAGECEAAVALYREGASRTTNLPERNYLLMKAASLDIGRPVG